MFLESRLSFNDSDFVSYKYVIYLKKVCIIHEN